MDGDQISFAAAGLAAVSFFAGLAAAVLSVAALVGCMQQAFAFAVCSFLQQAFPSFLQQALSASLSWARAAPQISIAAARLMNIFFIGTGFIGKLL
jgi:hypothetical protein